MFSLILNYISYNNIVDETNQENETMQSSNSSSSGGSYQTPAGISANASNGTAENGDIHTHMAVRGRPNEQDLLLHDEITDDSMIAEVDMTQAQKKRKLEDLYSTHDFSKMKIDEYELIKLKRIIRNNIYRTVNFLRGEDYFDYDNDCNLTEARKDGQGNKIYMGDFYHSEFLFGNLWDMSESYHDFVAGLF